MNELRHLAFRSLPILLLAAAPAAHAQIDPVARNLVQLGYNQPMEGRAPIAAYAYYYYNKPDFYRTNLTLRLAVAPTYVDSDFGFRGALGAQTDLSLGLAGGGFADSYNEIRGGRWLQKESFDGHSVELSGNLYHLFNPADQIPLNFVLHTGVHGSIYTANNDTSPNFRVPDDMTVFNVRTGLRYGGIEPTLFPDLAMELAVWYEGEFRTVADKYGFNNDRQVNPSSHLFWASAALSYTLPESKQNFFVRMVAGTSVNADRLSAYKLGGFLPLVAEYPLSIPGYFYQEFDARQFALINASYIIPIAPNERWNLMFNGATAGIDYVDARQSPGNWVSGVGAGILYNAPDDRFKVIVDYAYGVDAQRDTGHGASSVSVLLQWDLGKNHSHSFQHTQPHRWAGWNWIMGR